MSYIRRVTLRCLCDDLAEDWNDTAQQRAFGQLRRRITSDSPDSDIALALEGVPTVTLAAHPLVRSFRAAFDSTNAGLHRESISGLREPHWWKQKISRWRGAATDSTAAGDNEVWLCAGGLRADGDDRDFYKRFVHTVESEGPEKYLPATEDRRLQAIEAKVARRDAWLEQVRLAALVCLDKAVRTNEPQSQHIPGPAPASADEPILHLVFDILRVGDNTEDLVELSLVVEGQNLAKPKLVGSAIDAVRSVIEPSLEEWQVLPGAGTDQIWTTLVSMARMTRAQSVVERGVLPEDLKHSTTVIGLQAHFTEKDQIVDATVQGDPVRGLCGKWFVPTANPHDLPVCPICDHRHGALSS